MTDLDEFLGAILAGVSHARRIADEESTAIAEYYKDNPLLAGMAVPRVRIPEFTIDIPLLIEDQEQKQPPKFRPRGTVAKEVANAARNAIKERGVKVPASTMKAFEVRLSRQLQGLTRLSSGRPAPAREQFVKVSELTFIDTLRDEKIEMPPDVQKAILGSLRRAARENLLEKPGLPPRLKVNVLTAEVKDKAAPVHVARIKLTVREEGLEWTTIEHDDGSSESRLTPE